MSLRSAVDYFLDGRSMRNRGWSSDKFRSGIDIANEEYEKIRDENERLRDEIARLRGNDELQKTKNALNDVISNSVQVLSDNEMERCKMFSRMHYTKCGSKSPYFHFTYVGVGTITELICPVCKEEVDITEYELW